MDKKNYLVLYLLFLIVLFSLNFLVNFIFPSIGNSSFIFLSIICCTGIFSYLIDNKKINVFFLCISTLIIIISFFFSNMNITDKLQEWGLEPTFYNYILALFSFGFDNIKDIKKILILPGFLWIVIFNYIAFLIADKLNRKRDFFEKKIRESVNSIKEIKKYKQDNERYEKTVSELQEKVIELSSRTLVLKDFASSIGSSFEPKEIFNSIIEATIKLIDSDQTMILTFDKTKKLKIAAAHNISKEEVKNLNINPDDGIIGMIIKNRTIMTSEDIQKNFQLTELHKMDKIPIQIAAPVESDDGRLLAVLVINKMKSNIQKEHIRMFSILINIATLSLENSKLFKKVEFMANVDGLTKLYTHRYFQEFLSEELARATRYKRPLSIIMSDIDHFKNFNDKYGHQVGDMVLEQTAKIFKASVRNKVDLVARYGGEEFIAVLPETDVKSAFIVADRLRKNIENAAYDGENGQVLRVTASLGIAGFPVSSTEKLDLIKKADTALYYAKENGRNQVQIFDKEKMKIVEK